MKIRVLIGLVMAMSLAVTGCSDSDSNGTGGDGGMGGDGGTGGMGGDGGTGGGGPVVPKTCDDVPDSITGYIVEGAPPTATDDCDVTLDPTGDNDHRQILDALVNNEDELQGGGKLCLSVGNWDMGGTVAITDLPGLTLKGIGDSPADVVLDYADENGDCRGGKGISAGVNDVTVENLWVKNTCENAIEQSDVDGSVFRKVIVSWDDRCERPNPPAECDDPCAPRVCNEASDNAGAPCVADVECTGEGEEPACVDTDEVVCGDDERLVCSTTLVGGAEGTCVGNMTLNGAYGIYPTDCSNTTVEYCQAQGASDAGIYVGKCTGGIVQNNIVYENVAGLEVENCVGVESMNNTAFDNVGGLFALQQDISGSMQSNTDVRFIGNESYCNNRPNFAKPRSAVAGIPVGTGVLSFAGDGVEFANNVITDNVTLGIGVASNLINCQVSGGDCPTVDGQYNEGYDPYVKRNYIHDNVFTNNGTAPTGDFGILFQLLGFGTEDGPPVPDVVWDGYQPRVCEGGEAEGDQCYGNVFACVGGENDGNSCSMAEDCPDGACVHIYCPDGTCVPGADTVNDAENCLGTDADAAASLLVLGDECGDIGVPDIPTYFACVAANQPTDPTPFYCEPSE